MTLTLSVEVGDKVHFKSRLPNDRKVILAPKLTPVSVELPENHKLNVVMIDGVQNIVEQDEITWSEHLGGIKGFVDCIDVQQQLIRVRGKDKTGEDYTVWIEPEHLVVDKKAMDFS